MTILQLLRSNSRWIEPKTGKVYTIDIYPVETEHITMEKMTITPLFKEVFTLGSETDGILCALGNPSSDFLDIRMNDDESIKIARYEHGIPKDFNVLVKSDIPAAEAEPTKRRRRHKTNQSNIKINQK